MESEMTEQQAESGNPGRGRRRMPVRSLPPFDLGRLAERDGLGDAAKALAETWRGWTVTYRDHATMAMVQAINSGDVRHKLEFLGRIVAGWNFVDEAGEPLPQPSRDSFMSLALDLPDDLLIAMIEGYPEALAAPKETISGS